MLNVYLLRHGETCYNADGNRYCGRTDVELTNKGYEQARSVGKQLAKISFDGVYSSPLKRAYLTAKLAAGAAEVSMDDRLIEVDFGEWEGLTKEEFIKKDENSWRNWLKEPDFVRAGGTGESALDVVNRVEGFFKDIMRRHKSGNILVVAHNGVNRLYIAHKLGMPLRNYRRILQDNSSVTMFSLDEKGELNLRYLNSRL